MLHEMSWLELILITSSFLGPLSHMCIYHARNKANVGGDFANLDSASCWERCLMRFSAERSSRARSPCTCCKKEPYNPLSSAPSIPPFLLTSAFSNFFCQTAVRASEVASACLLSSSARWTCLWYCSDRFNN